MTKSNPSFSNRLNKEPLIKFLMISIGIYMIYGLYGTRDEDTLAKENTITITSQEIDIMAFMWEQRYNRKPILYVSLDCEKATMVTISDTIKKYFFIDWLFFQQ